MRIRAGPVISIPETPAADWKHHIMCDGGASPNPGPTGCGITVATGKFATDIVSGCKRKKTGEPSSHVPCTCGLDWTEHIHTCVSVHVADGNTNNDGEWMAVLRAAQYISEHGLTDVEIITDSMVVTKQLSNSMGVNEPRHAAERMRWRQ